MQRPCLLIPIAASIVLRQWAKKSRSIYLDGSDAASGGKIETSSSTVQ